MKFFLNIYFYFLLISVFLFPSYLYSQENKYRISDISPELIKNSKAVIRDYKLVYKVKSINKASLKVTYAITILNKNGIDNSYFMQFYNKFSRIHNIKATVYDKNGKKIKKIKSHYILDYSAISGYSLYEDNRVKYIDPNIKKTPFTIEYSFIIDFNGSFAYPKWQLYKDYNVSIENSTFEVIIPKDIKFRYIEKNISSKAKIIHKEDQITYIWDTTNLSAIKKEPFSLPLIEYTPVVFSAPSDFEIGGYKGNCDSWKNFGQWINLLNENKNQLSEETQNTLKNIVKNAKDEYEKIKLIYEYLQNKTRYVSIQAGIGGWQPFDAATVDRLSYGDCKALTNYMKSMLDVICIKSYYTLVYAGKNVSGLINEFPSNQFNHVLLCVPINNDTIWLECTDQDIPFGYLGTFTDDRYVLLINENGGKIIHTTSYNEDDNQQLRKINIILNNNGDGQALVSTCYKGLIYDELIKILRSDDSDKKKLMYNRIKIPNFEIINFNHNEIKNRIPYVEEKLELKLNNYGINLGERMLITINLMNKIDELPKEIKNRKSDIFIRKSYTEIDTLIYTIPSNYVIEEIPTKKEILSCFGEYKIYLESNDINIKYIRYLKINKGLYSKDLYKELISFFEDIINADNLKMILKRVN
jgi:hypothetical protein